MSHKLWLQPRILNDLAPSFEAFLSSAAVNSGEQYDVQNLVKVYFL